MEENGHRFFFHCSHSELREPSNCECFLFVSLGRTKKTKPRRDYRVLAPSVRNSVPALTAVTE